MTRCKVALNEKYPRRFDCSRSNSHFGRGLGLFHEVGALPELRLDPSVQGTLLQAMSLSR